MEGMQVEDDSDSDLPPYTPLCRQEDLEDEELPGFTPLGRVESTLETIEVDVTQEPVEEVLASAPAEPTSDSEDANEVERQRSETDAETEAIRSHILGKRREIQTLLAAIQALNPLISRLRDDCSALHAQIQSCSRVAGLRRQLGTLREECARILSRIDAEESLRPGDFLGAISRAENMAEACLRDLQFSIQTLHRIQSIEKLTKKPARSRSGWLLLLMLGVLLGLVTRKIIHKLR